MTLREAAQATADNLECVCEVTRHPPCHVCALRTALASPSPDRWEEGYRAGLEAMRAALAPGDHERDPDEDESVSVCHECGDDYTLRDGCDPSPECDPCAHVVLARAREALAALPVPPATTPKPEAPRKGHPCHCTAGPDGTTVTGGCDDCSHTGIVPVRAPEAKTAESEGPPTLTEWRDIQKAAEFIVGHVGWDEEGATKPKECFRWETVARLALDLLCSVAARPPMNLPIPFMLVNEPSPVEPEETP